MSLPKTYVDLYHSISPTALWPGDRWIGRRVTRSGTRRFLMAAYPHDVGYRHLPPWLQLWKQISWVRDQAKEARVKIPSSAWAEDRARLGAKIAAFGSNRYYEEEHRRASRWSQR